MSQGDLLQSPANLLQSKGIAHLLRHYPNRRFVDTLISIVLFGARVGYEGPQSIQIRKPNHLSAYAHPDIVTNSIESEVIKGRIKQIEDLPANYYCSPIGLVPKMSNGEQTG